MLKLVFRMCYMHMLVWVGGSKESEGCGAQPPLDPNVCATRLACVLYHVVTYDT